MRQAGRVYRDRGGELWLDPGDGMLLSLDSQVLRVLREKWGVIDRSAAEEKFGRLDELLCPRDLMTPTEKWDLLALAEGKDEHETADVAMKVAGRARDADDAILLLEACGLRRYPKGARE
jgi:hypothetical protein